MYESVWLPRLQKPDETSTKNGQLSEATNHAANPGPNHGPDHGPNQLPPQQLTHHAIIHLVAQGNQPQGTIHHVMQMQQLHGYPPPGQQLPPAVAQLIEAEPDAAQSEHGSDGSGPDEDTPRNSKQERVRIRANWDPCYPEEKVSWYEEYIHRHAPPVVNWFEPARRRDITSTWVPVDAKGVALYRPGNSTQDLLAISPLDDGGICIWDVNGTRGKKGAIFAKSKPGLLYVDGPQGDNNRASKRIDSGVTECVSVDNQRHRAFFAVQSRKSSHFPFVVCSH